MAFNTNVSEDWTLLIRDVKGAYQAFPGKTE